MSSGPLVDPGAALLTPAWRALAVFRVATLGYAAVLVVRDHDEYTRPALGWAVLAVMALWTAVVVPAYSTDAGRTRSVASADLGVSVLLVLGTLGVESADAIGAGAPTLPAVWAAGPVLAWAVLGGARGGGLAALGVAAADLVVTRGEVSHSTVNSIVLLLLAGVVVGRVVRLGVAAELRVAAALEESAAARERERLARAVHDGTLQVLALVSRRGRDLGGEGERLAALAAEQESALRSLLTSVPTAGVAGTLDVRAVLLAGGSASRHVSAPSSPVLLPCALARELLAAVGECLANAALHAPSAEVWVLLEDLGDEVVVSVRDDGPGMEPSRVQEASAQGRMGLARSVLGRVQDLGGSVVVSTAPGQGCEVELRVPR